MEQKNKLKGGLSDGMSLRGIAVKHVKSDDKGKINEMMKKLKSQLRLGLNHELEHAKDEETRREIVMDHLYEDPNYYTNLTKIDTTEQTGADSSGSFEGPLSHTILKRDINTIPNFKTKEGDMNEVTGGDSSGSYDAPFGNGSKNPLKINGVKSIKQSRAVKDKNFPKWGGPGGVYVQVKEKCKKFPYCNQGDTGALDFFEVEGLKESVEEVSKKYKIPYSEMEQIVLNEIKKIFID